MLRLSLAFALLCCLSLLAFFAAAQGKCGTGQYQSSALVLSCNGGRGSMSLGLKKAEALSIGSFPAGTRDVSIALLSTVDFDMQLLDTNIGMCIAGFNCQHQVGCASDDDYCISYKQMPIYFSGDDEAPPVEEKMKIKGALTTPMDFAVYAQAVGSGTVEYAYSSLEPCPDPAPGCSPCLDYTACANGVPVCDGSSTVLCVPSPTPSTSPPVPSPTPTPAPVPPPSTNARTTTQYEAPTTTQFEAPVKTLSLTLTTTLPPSPCTTVVLQPGSIVPPRVPPPQPNPCAPVVGSANRPNVFAGLLRNISAGTRMVGGMIRQKVTTALDNLKARTSNKVKPELDKIRQDVIQEVNKVNNTFKQIGNELTSDAGLLTAKPTWPPAWGAKPSEWAKPTWPPSWKNTLDIMGKEKTMAKASAGSLTQRAPLAFGPWAASLFSSWTSTGSLCMMWLVAMLSLLFYATGFRFRTVIRKTVRVYAQVSPPAAAAAICQSRDLPVFSTLHADGDGLPSVLLEPDLENSRANLLSAEVE